MQSLMWDVPIACIPHICRTRWLTASTLPKSRLVHLSHQISNNLHRSCAHQQICLEALPGWRWDERRGWGFVANIRGDDWLFPYSILWTHSWYISGRLEMFKPIHTNGALSCIGLWASGVACGCKGLHFMLPAKAGSVFWCTWPLAMNR